MTPRHRWKRHHISVGRTLGQVTVIIVMVDLDVRVGSEIGELLRYFTLDPTRDYQARSRSSL
ncbi:MAG TPA: hypothetical protein VMV53_05170 [Acidimicrobiales bacterium]|nr:hypothetical protein [Acidimicrobiales bacterium]